jgi:hypothetical protein
MAAARHRWEKQAEHLYRCVKPGCGFQYLNARVGDSDDWTRHWRAPDGRKWSTGHGDHTPPCEATPQPAAAAPDPAAAGSDAPAGPPEPPTIVPGTCTLCGPVPAPVVDCAGRLVVVTRRRPGRPYAAGWRCDAHAPWAQAGGAHPELRGQYSIVGAQRHAPPQSAGWAAVDARAIASGKRRGTPEQVADARAAVVGQHRG